MEQLIIYYLSNYLFIYKDLKIALVNIFSIYYIILLYFIYIFHKK